MVKDHPRRCGENLLTYGYNSNNMGSPPQVRGKLKNWKRLIFRLRITPAGAGKTPPVCETRRIHRDHPRRCGENLADSRAMSAPEGSPPQVRGKRTHGGDAVGYIGITPAGAGKTALTDKLQSTGEDHPRRCGENFFRRHPCRVGRGSPPQVRGKRADNCPVLPDF